jgi:hypothetical protein
MLHDQPDDLNVAVEKRIGVAGLFLSSKPFINALVPVASRSSIVRVFESLRER